MQSDERITYLLRKYLEKSISKNEYEELSDWLIKTEFKNLENLLDIFVRDDQYIRSEVKEFNEAAILKKIQTKISTDRKNILQLRWRYYAAVAIILIFCFFVFRPAQLLETVDFAENRVDKGDVYAADIPILENKGGNLTFADGETVILRTHNQKIINTKDSRYQILADGGLRLEPKQDQEINNAQHTFWTGRGDRAYIILEDGTSVWLSSSSSLVFPTKFANDRREVEVCGEAFFNVQHDASKPFVVKSSRTEVQVLGTEFNVKAYPESDFSQTTLFSGSINVKSETNQTTIVPGEQAIVKNTGKLTVDSVNLQEIISWQSDVYRFSNLTVEEILKELSRWYDIQGIDGYSSIKDRYTGTLSKANKLSEILKQLEIISNNKFAIKGRRIIIMD